MHSMDRQINADLKSYLVHARVERSRAFFDLSRATFDLAARVFSLVGGLLKRQGHRYARLRERRRDIAALAQLDRRTLRDMGLQPSTIGAAVTDRHAAQRAELKLKIVPGLAAANDDHRTTGVKLAN